MMYIGGSDGITQGVVGLAKGTVNTLAFSMLWSRHSAPNPPKWLILSFRLLYRSVGAYDTVLV